MKKRLSLALSVFVIFLVFGCGGGGSGGDTSKEDQAKPTIGLKSVDIVGEWDYQKKLTSQQRAVSCDKVEKGVLTILQENGVYHWTTKTNNSLMSDCTFGGQKIEKFLLDFVKNDVITPEVLLNSLKKANSAIKNVIFNSDKQMTMDFSNNTDNLAFVTIFQRDDLKFNGIKYSGTYQKTSGTNCQEKGTVSAYVENGEVKGSASTDYGTPILITGFKISNGKYEGTTSDGTNWKGVVTSDKVYSTYLNPIYHCEGTSVVSRVE